MTASDRSARTAAADALCAAAFERAGAAPFGVALVAVGGYGRGELAPCSDLDVVLVHDEAVVPGRAAEELWYPLWDSGVRLDHAVRSTPEMLSAADADLRVGLGLLDLRHLAGDPNLTLRLRSAVLARWRQQARHRLPSLRDLVRARHERVGELAHLSVPDLKEAAGGLRDATVLRALVATWLVDVPHVELAASHRSLLDVRDVLHDCAGRATDRVAPELWSDLAAGLGLEDAGQAQRHVREVGRRLAHLSRLTWRRVESLRPPARATGVRRPELAPVAPGVVLAAGELVLDRSARPTADPLLLLRAAAEASERGVVLAPATAARLAREAAALPEPWPAAARQLLVRLLAGRGLLDVWETLDETGGLPRILPEWERIRLLPHASPIHRFTVDRHAVETCVEAAQLIRRVSRPDLLMVAALLHDIGKGDLTEHSVAGERIARQVATRMGFDGSGVGTIGRLVRWHLLLAQTAATRDAEDPATVAHVSGRVGDAGTARLLLALTEADARATSPRAWSRWRARLVTDLGLRVLANLEDDVPPPPTVPAAPSGVACGGAQISVVRKGDGARVTVVAPDRVGLLADLAGVLALQRASIRAARARSDGGVAVSVWDVADQHLDPAVLGQRYEAVRTGRVDPAAGLPRPGNGPAPGVAVRPDASARATVLEVRAGDAPGVVHLVCSALAGIDVTVCSAHVDTLGPQAVDVFYVQEEGAGALSEARAAAASHAVRAALSRC